jgi:hypothetical protein
LLRGNQTYPPAFLENEPLSAHPRYFPLTGTAFTAGAVRLFITFDFEDVRENNFSAFGSPRYEKLSNF